MDQPITQRPDVDIEDDIHQLIRSYAPLQISRGYFHIEVSNGNVVFRGNVRIPQARRVLLENTLRIPGVKNVDISQLYDDEMVRFKVGEQIPPGVVATVQFGAVALTGKLPPGVSAEAITEAVSHTPGVRRVGVHFIEES